MSVERTIAVVVLFGLSGLTQHLFAAEPEAPLTYQEECQVTLLTVINAVMAGLSRDADEQMQRVAEIHGPRMEEPAFLETVKDCKLPGNLSVDQQNLVVERAKCRYRDLLLSEYERDGVPVPDKWATLCQDDD